jgi:hypothetical protein
MDKMDFSKLKSYAEALSEACGVEAEVVSVDGRKYTYSGACYLNFYPLKNTPISRIRLRMAYTFTRFPKDYPDDWFFALLENAPFADMKRGGQNMVIQAAGIDYLRLNMALHLCRLHWEEPESVCSMKKVMDQGVCAPLAFLLAQSYSQRNSGHSFGWPSRNSAPLNYAWIYWHLWNDKAMTFLPANEAPKYNYINNASRFTSEPLLSMAYSKDDIKELANHPKLESILSGTYESAKRKIGILLNKDKKKETVKQCSATSIP